MKSIHDIRRENLKELIYREFNGIQSRLAERMETQPNLINRWASGKKIIGDVAARKIEKAANKPTNWLDIDKFMPVHEEVQDVDFGEIGELASWNLKRWMSENRNLSSQQRLAEESGVSQSTINRFLNNEASISITNLAALAEPFGRHAYELLLPPDDPAAIEYDRARYKLLPESDKMAIANYIDFVIVKHEKPHK